MALLKVLLLLLGESDTLDTLETLETLDTLDTLDTLETLPLVPGKLLLSVTLKLPSDSKRIIGVHDCDDTERLYHVRLQRSKGTETFRCGGSLIHSEWILTAAHFLSEGDQVFCVNPSRSCVYTRHGQRHDIMLLKLQTPVTDVPPAQLPRCNNRLKK
uniref:Peptidase S1 domain-containing protein n=1 Tax=Xiphophorus maculatus TaxID=8083 RepID=A0A3B5R9Q7_XIPMA